MSTSHSTEPHPAVEGDLFRQIFDRNQAVHLLIDPGSGRIVEANPAACRFYGRSGEELTSLSIGDINALAPAQVREAIEITEGPMQHSPEATREMLARLKALGVRITIDDFGIGHSSLSVLKRLPIDALKIDRSFVRNLGSDPEDAAVATAVIAIAHTLRLQAVAEGVETEEQRAFLAARGCDRIQGHLFSEPVPAEACEAFLARHRT